MAVLRNPYAGDDPDPEDDDRDDEHAPGCRCDICEEERAITGTDDEFDQQDDDGDDRDQPI